MQAGNILIVDVESEEVVVAGLVRMSLLVSMVIAGTRAKPVSVYGPDVEREELLGFGTAPEEVMDIGGELEASSVIDTVDLLDAPELRVAAGAVEMDVSSLENLEWVEVHKGEEACVHAELEMISIILSKIT